MAIIRYPGLFGYTNPFQELARMKKEMDRLFSSYTGGGAPLSAASGVFPALNVREVGDKYYVEAEVPGIKPESIEIAVEGSTLTLRGERFSEKVEDASYHRRERKAGKFQKAITLPMDINADAIEAECRDGVLRLVLPKAEHAKPRKIEIRSA